MNYYQMTIDEYMDSRLPTISDFIYDKQLHISESNWQMLNASYSQQELIRMLKAEILSGNIELPIRRLTIEDAKESFLSLKEYQCNSIQIGDLVTRYNYEFDEMGEGPYIDESNIGNAASDYFHQESRFRCGSINAPSPVRVWENGKFLDGMLKALWSLGRKTVDDKAFRTCLSLRKYIASQFKPSVAKSIYEKFHSVNVLDFSCGWGDRFCGFYSCKDTRSYIGIDPNRNTQNGYRMQEQLYGSLQKKKQATFICKPAEEVKLPEGIVDTAFTSPPYFNAERYSDDDTQSYKRYKKLDSWLDGFLFPTLRMAVNALKSGGHLLLNISDVYTGHKVNKICDPMNRYLQSLGLEYGGV